MNERIKDLLPNPLAVDYQYKDGPLDLYTEKEMLRFAELIVRECMEQVWYSREDGINGNVSEVIKERMKQHFGVEE